MGCGCLKRSEIIESSHISSIKESNITENLYHPINTSSSYTSNNTSKRFYITSEEDITEKSINIRKSNENLEDIMTNAGKEKTEFTTMNICSSEKSVEFNKIDSFSISRKKEGPIITLLQKHNNNIRQNKKV